MHTKTSASEPPAYRGLLVASLIASISYFIVRDALSGAGYMIAWKGAAVALLALYAGVQARDIDGWLLTAGLTLGALGDMVLELSMLAGGGLFALGHMLMIGLFLRNRRKRRTGSQTLAGVALSLGPPLIAAFITSPDPRWPAATVYAAVIGAMAAAAWTSRFPRYRVGLGAVMFVISDLMIFAREAAPAADGLAWWTVWPLYYAGQFLIATGVVRTLYDRGAIPRIA